MQPSDIMDQEVFATPAGGTSPVTIAGPEAPSPSLTKRPDQTLEQDVEDDLCRKLADLQHRLNRLKTFIMPAEHEMNFLVRPFWYGDQKMGKINPAIHKILKFNYVGNDEESRKNTKDRLKELINQLQLHYTGIDHAWIEYIASSLAKETTQRGQVKFLHRKVTDLLQHGQKPEFLDKFNELAPILSTGAHLNELLDQLTDLKAKRNSILQNEERLRFIADQSSKLSNLQQSAKSLQKHDIPNLSNRLSQLDKKSIDLCFRIERLDKEFMKSVGRLIEAKKLFAAMLVR